MAMMFVVLSPANALGYEYPFVADNLEEARKHAKARQDAKIWACILNQGEPCNIVDHYKDGELQP